MSHRPDTPSPASVLHRIPPGVSREDFLRERTDESCRAHFVSRHPADLRRYYEWRSLYQSALGLLGDEIE